MQANFFRTTPRRSTSFAGISECVVKLVFKERLIQGKAPMLVNMPFNHAHPHQIWTTYRPKTLLRQDCCLTRRAPSVAGLELSSWMRTFMAKEARWMGQKWTTTSIGVTHVRVEHPDGPAKRRERYWPPGDTERIKPRRRIRRDDHSGSR